VKGLVIGTLKGLGATGEEAYSAIGALASSIVKTTAHTGGDVVAATKGLISGVVHSAKNL